ncbi:hypothetical protein ACIBL3_09470 [Kribbella sp. NPDC050124]
MSEWYALRPIGVTEALTRTQANEARPPAENEPEPLPAEEPPVEE